MEVFRQPGFLTLAECIAVRRAMGQGEAEDAEILLEGVQAGARRAALIDPPLATIDAIEAKLDGCRGAVAHAFGVTLDRREGAGFIRYPEGGFYRPHRDRGNDPGWEGAARRAVALVLFLNTSRTVSPTGEFDGGVLRLLLPDRDVDVTPEAGTLVAFPADVLHEVTEVRGGTRDAIVDWFYELSDTSA